ncbi:MAG: glycosyltransferase 87 family protein [Solirubrobacteraceae bacterium]
MARQNAPCALIALVGCGTLAWLGLFGFAWNDYDNEARPAFDALVHGQLAQFLRLAPAYGGSLVERAPFALIPQIWGGGELAVYRSVAAPCLLASALLGVWLVARMRSEGRPLGHRAIALAVCVANPITLGALEVGHPEELLGACLCVAAVLFAGEDRGLLAGALLGLAIANKPWALLAAGPVLLALPARRRPTCLGVAVLVGAAVLGPLALVGGGGFASATRASASAASTIFQPWQVWWFFGHHGALVHGAFGAAKPGYRIGPSWIAAASHPLVILCGLALAVWLWRGQRSIGRLGARRALLALAVVMLTRCLLDTWDTEYYFLPFVMAVLAWETCGPLDRPPIVALASSALAWLSFRWLPTHCSPDLQSALFLAWTVPLAGTLAQRLFRARGQIGVDRSQGARASAGQATTVSALSRPLSTS